MKRISGIGFAGFVGALVLSTLVAGSSFAAPPAPAAPAPAPTPTPASPGPAFVEPLTITASAGTTCGQPLKANVYFKRNLAVINPVSGTIQLKLVNGKPHSTPYTIEPGPIGSTVQVTATHPGTLNCSTGIDDEVIEVRKTGVTNPIFAKQVAPKKFFTDTLIPAPAASGPYVAKVQLEADCGGTGKVTKLHLEQVGSGSGSTTIAMTFGGTTVTRTLNVPYSNPLQDLTMNSAGPFDCKAATGLAPFTWTLQQNGTPFPNGSTGPAHFSVVFN